MTPEKVVSSETSVGSDDVKESMNDSNKEEIGDANLDDTEEEVGVASGSQNSEQEQTNQNTKEIKQQEDAAEIPNDADAQVNGKDAIDVELKSSKGKLDTLNISEDPPATTDERNTLEDSMDSNLDGIDDELEPSQMKIETLKNSKDPPATGKEENTLENSTDTDVDEFTAAETSLEEDNIPSQLYDLSETEADALIEKAKEQINTLREKEDHPFHELSDAETNELIAAAKKEINNLKKDAVNDEEKAHNKESENESGPSLLRGWSRDSSDGEGKGILKQIRKAGVAVTGGALVVAGLPLIPMPTPGGVVVVGSGMALLATEFPAAAKMFDKSKKGLANLVGDESDDDEEKKEKQKKNQKIAALVFQDEEEIRKKKEKKRMNRLLNPLAAVKSPKSSNGGSQASNELKELRAKTINAANGAKKNVKKFIRGTVLPLMDRMSAKSPDTKALTSQSAHGERRKEESPLRRPASAGGERLRNRTFSETTKPNVSGIHEF
ncbi:predicted protein [Chaetoceros tenuissimus]|uniref:Uncharacterized protein n=1 Tax=Chaetoceros tenuissimus TaxID=426638 RepID=A0AAD3D7H6_9STRA|nr:predicted protein [Chaetoceros tenuissimus]